MIGENLGNHMSVKLSGHRDNTTHRKEEGTIFPIMLGPSPPAPIWKFDKLIIHFWTIKIEVTREF